jgi:hypothetical protein
LHEAAAQNNATICQILLEAGARLDHVGNDGNTVLHLAAVASACAAIQLILERKPDLAVINAKYMTALDVIEKNRQLGWGVGAALLRDAGAKNSTARSHIDCPESFKPKPQEDDQQSGVSTAPTARIRRELVTFQ